jgi:hypothetical protein
MPIVTCYNTDCIYNSQYDKYGTKSSNVGSCESIHITIIGPNNECSNCDESEIGGGAVW